MIAYRLGIAPSESEGEGEDCDEWFSSLSAAKRRRGELIKENPCLFGNRYKADFRIDRVEVRGDLSRRKLILALLNRRGCFAKSEVVVEEYEAIPGCIACQDQPALPNDRHCRACKEEWERE